MTRRSPPPEKGDPELAWVDAHLRKEGRFHRADWRSIGASIEGTFSPERREHAWDSAALRWLSRTAKDAGRGFAVHESRNFLLLAPGLEGDERTLLRFLEHSHRTVMESLPGIAAEGNQGRMPVLVLRPDRRYYDYVDWFYPPGGSYPFSGGVCLREGLPHVAIPWTDLAAAEKSLAHELSHARVGHLEIPQWIDEGMATIVEGIATGGSRQLLVPEELLELRKWWDPETLQTFWNGGSFHAADDGFTLGYRLAYHLVKILSQDIGRFRAFVLAARLEDAGEAASREVFGESLGSVAARILGPGDWSPRPRCP